MKIAIFGSGHYGRQAMEEIGIDKVEYFIDNNPDKWGIQYRGKQIINLEKYKEIADKFPSVKKIVAYCEEHAELKEKVTVVMRKSVEVLTNRGGDAPNRKKTDYMSSFGCVMPFKQMIVRPDGKVSLCCNDPYGKYTMGDLSKENIKDVWYGEKFRKVRESMRKGRGNCGECRYCDTALLF